MAEAPAWLEQQAYAHRGLHDGDMPENSLGSFAAAIEKGLGIECDVRVSADGRAMVFHDAELDRMAGKSGAVGSLTVGDLTALQLNNSQEHIPTLRDMLQLVDTRVPMLLELKTDGSESIHKLCRAVRRDIEGYSGEVAVMSFDPRVSAWFAGHVPSLPRGLVVTEQGARTLSGALKRRLSVSKADPHFLAYDIRDLPSRFARKQARAGLPILTWTVRSGQQLDTATEFGAVPILEGSGVAAWEQAT